MAQMPWRHVGPLSIGLILSAYWSWRFGSSLVLNDQMWGYGWPGYVLEAWLVEHGEIQRMDDLRTPLYPGLLGTLGEAMGSYANAGVLISSVAVLFCALAVGIGATALSSGWAGGLAAVCATIALTHQEAPTTVNQYPLLAALCAMAMAMGAVTSRWPGLTWAALAGLFSGLAWMLESRGILVLPVVTLLVGLGVFTHRKNRPWRLGLAFSIPLLVCSFLRIEMVDAQRQEGENTAAYEAQLVDRQRDVVQRWIQTEQHLRDGSCRDVDRADLLQPAFVGSDCSLELVSHNISERLPRHLPLGWGMSLFLGCCVLLPGRRGIKGSIESSMLWLIGGGGILLLACLTPMPRRYLLQATPLLAMCCAAGPDRLVQMLPLHWFDRRPSWLQPGLQALATTSILLWMLSGGRSGQAQPETHQLGEHYYRYNQLTTLAQSHLQSGDGLLDCGEHHVELALLPHRTHPNSPSKQADLGICLDWIENPWTETGTAWLFTSSDSQLHWRRY